MPHNSTKNASNATITSNNSTKRVKDTTTKHVVTLSNMSSDVSSNESSKNNNKVNKIESNKINKTESNKINNDNENHISKFNQLDEITKMFKFKTLGSGIIRPDVMYYAVKNLDRKSAIFSLARYVPIGIADVVECGVLEFTLIQISNEQSDVIEFTKNIYKEKINDLCVNLDPHNKRINNHSLRGSLIEGGLDPHFVAFMDPRQLHPARWSKELDKQRNIEDANNNKKVTDIYQCRKCHDRKSTTTQMQTRSADEPMTIFVTCLTCYNTFTTQ